MTETAVFGGGCFWCTEAVFRNLKGVAGVTPGYAGGSLPDPTYQNVSTGETGHAEVVKIDFDPKEIFYQTLLEVFFALHDPTTVDRQGADVGTQYRSLILYMDEKQKQAAQKAKAEIAGAVTEIKQLSKFYPAEEYHINYYEKNIDYPYCQVVISPKLAKLREKYGPLMTNTNRSTEGLA
jgi:peptide-methionine (S)-S-oxide reductase